MGAGESTMASPAIKQSVDQLIKANKVMIFSKSYCPYCTMAKKVFKEMGQEYGLIELDETQDGSSMQQYLAQITGASSVPRVFVSGNCIGGGTETRSLYQSGQLKSMLA
ncbi:glutaredoxin-C4-like [Amphibalanus amphitrite]|uniref:glutaredoxin-C4-like n=1 Tax=Amphibalanus amphitrite TaxID=1232801 RepID=UPI001C90A510|nr:glutaredoxin-C4-like [Amphibalanus amphitrite]XP_043194656.1 glutaredoxin-C4-like [Amphibalanus amphitrite]XP_043194657.1 glutaredoxin-C4-like [Amphibalanus amphitrite]XP_043194658.1 glutaredoxin-C4-like [Amphibalanus amphitrite]XP_043194660.1 glutaredoxin-C4-like [Amphibalanus amphitrite]XP_043194661.1 glutaredoxin-C4-like [Amphibalanus amphitrite]XP_043194662.1 glutaredoxin-C4-like [Amphibalanus amphitrite]XP_043194663.1 glutaredoxin-C4-like [Amphibalanus amphitrite]XP_043194664.1 glut